MLCPIPFFLYVIEVCFIKNEILYSTKSIPHFSHNDNASREKIDALGKT